MKQFWEVLLLATDGIKSFLGLDFDKVSYSDYGYPIFIGLTLLIIVATKIFWKFFKTDRNIQKQSGYAIVGYHKRKKILGVLYFLPKFLVALGVIGILVVLMGPLLDDIKVEKKVVESRIRVDLRDGSWSMTELFPGSNKSKAEVAAEAHLKFLKMRKGKNDRTSLWLFASYPHIVEDFITDDDLYFDQVEDAPWICWGGDVDFFYIGVPDFRVPKERITSIQGEGSGTDMILILRAVLKQFDEDKASRNAIRKSVLIITDAEVNKFPLIELQELKKRKIIPLILFIRSSLPQSSLSEDDGSTSSVPTQNINDNVPEFAERIREYGGQYFDIIDENSLKQAFETVDRLEKVKIETIKKVFKIDLFQLFLLVTVFLMFIAILFLLLFEPFNTYP